MSHIEYRNKKAATRVSAKAIFILISNGEVRHHTRHHIQRNTKQNHPKDLGV